MKKHLRKHTGERPFKCQECGEGFTQMHNLRYHMLNHNGLKPYPCSRCPKGFRSLKALKDHELLTHWLVVPKKEPSDVLLQQTVFQENIVPINPVIEKEKSNKFSLDLIGVLNSTQEGKMLLSRYSERSNFTEEERSKLAALVLAFELRHVRERPSIQRFRFLADKIVETFPSEKKEVWVTEVISSGGRIALKGKFSSCGTWRNMTAGGSEKNMQTHAKDLPKPSGEGESNRRKDGASSRNWEEIWSSVEQNWKITTISRLWEVNSVKDVLHDYFRKYSFLAEPMGFSLLEKDFEFLYPTSSHNLIAEWPKLSAFFESLLREQIPGLQGISCQEKRMMEILTNLTRIFPEVYSKEKVGDWRPSRPDSQQAFLLVIKTYEKLLPFMDFRTSMLSKIGLNYLPPLPVVIGSTETSIKCFVIFDTAMYEVDNPLKAIDLTFKIFHSLHLPYPPDCDLIWTFLQQAVYKISTEKDTKHVTTSEFISKYKKFSVHVIP